MKGSGELKFRWHVVKHIGFLLLLQVLFHPFTNRLHACSYYCDKEPLEVSFSKSTAVFFGRHIATKSYPDLYKDFGRTPVSFEQFELLYYYSDLDFPDSPEVLSAVPFTLLSNCGECGGACFEAGEYYVVFLFKRTRRTPLPAVSACSGTFNVSDELGYKLRVAEDWLKTDLHKELNKIAHQIPYANETTASDPATPTEIAWQQVYENQRKHSEYLERWVWVSAGAAGLLLMMLVVVLVRRKR